MLLAAADNLAHVVMKERPTNRAARGRRRTQDGIGCGHLATASGPSRQRRASAAAASASKTGPIVSAWMYVAATSAALKGRRDPAASHPADGEVTAGAGALPEDADDQLTTLVQTEPRGYVAT